MSFRVLQLSKSALLPALFYIFLTSCFVMGCSDLASSVNPQIQVDPAPAAETSPTDFVALVNETSSPFNIRIENIGKKDLEITAMYFDTESHSAFNATYAAESFSTQTEFDNTAFITGSENSSIVISKDNSILVALRFSPDNTSDTFLGHFVIESDDLETPTVIFPVKGGVSDAGIVVQVSSDAACSDLQAGAVFNDFSDGSSQWFWVQNPGETDLVIDSMSVVSWARTNCLDEDNPKMGECPFTQAFQLVQPVMGPNAPIAAGAGRCFTIEYETPSPGGDMGRVLITTNASSAPYPLSVESEFNGKCISVTPRILDFTGGDGTTQEVTVANCSKTDTLLISQTTFQPEFPDNYTWSYKAYTGTDYTDNACSGSELCVLKKLHAASIEVVYTPPSVGEGVNSVLRMGHPRTGDQQIAHEVALLGSTAIPTALVKKDNGDELTSPYNVNIGSVDLGATLTTTLTIENAGQGTLYVMQAQLEPNPADIETNSASEFALDNSNFVTAIRDIDSARNIDVTYTRGTCDTGDHEAWLAVYTSDPSLYSVGAANDLVIHYETSVTAAQNAEQPVGVISFEEETYSLENKVKFDADASTIPSGKTISSYFWSLARPDGSTAILDDPFLNESAFIPDVTGDYIVSLSLIADDCTAPIASTTITVVE